MNLDDLDIWKGTVDISDKVYDDDDPAAYLPASYKDILTSDRLPVTNPMNGATEVLPIKYHDDEEQKRLRLSVGGLAALGATPGQPAQVDFTPSSNPDDYLNLRSMAYGPVVGEHGHSQMFGPAENPLGDKDVAVSPDVEGKFPMDSYIEDSKGNVLHVADRSYVHPGQPTSGTVERRDVGDLGHEQYRLLTPEEVQQRLGETPERALLAGNPTAASIQFASQPSDDEKKNATVDPDGTVFYHDKLNTRVNPKTGLVMRDVGGFTSVTSAIGGGKFQTHWIKQEAMQPSKKIESEALDFDIPVFDEDGKRRPDADIAKELAASRQGRGILPKAVQQEAERIATRYQSSRNPYIVDYLKLYPNAESARTYLGNPNRTGIDDMLAIQALANIEAPGRSSTGHDMELMHKTAGLTGKLEVLQGQYKALLDKYSSGMSQDDQNRQGRLLSDEQAKELLDRIPISMKPRYDKYIAGINPGIKRLQSLGVDPYEFMPEALPFDKSASGDANTVQPATSPRSQKESVSLSDEQAYGKATEILAHPESYSQADLDLANRTLSSLRRRNITFP
jgi:hypothetical protein